MKKFFTLFQWAVVIALALFAAHRWTRPIPPPDYAPDAWASWNGFHAISYAGVTRRGGGDHVTPAQLASHLQALRDAGYRAITPEDAEAFLQGIGPLPQKAVLLLFEGGRKDSYLFATPLLRTSGLVATMCVPTQFTRRWGSFYLRRGDLKKIARDAHWSLASMGHAAALPIPVGPDDSGRFLTKRQWVNGAVESLEAYRDRVENDFAKAAGVLAQAGKRPIAAYLFPFADAGSSADAAPEAAAILQQAVGAHHRIAFTRADEAYNGPDSDPLQLTRLRVSGHWDARRLLDELAKAEPRHEPVQGVGGPEAWSLTDGADVRAGRLSVPAGGLAWLRGSADWSDLDLDARIERAPQGTAALYLRYAGPTRYVRIVWSDAHIRVQERLGAHLQTLALLPAAEPPSTTHDVRIRLRGNRLWVLTPHDAEAVALPLTRMTTRGRIGVEALEGPAQLAAFSARPAAGILADAPSYRALPESERASLAVWMPRWFTASNAPALTEEMRRELLAAASAGIQVMPQLELGEAPPDHQQVVDALADALSIDVTRSLITRIALSRPDRGYAETLRARGYGILHRATPAQARELARSGRLGRDGDWIWLDGEPAEARDVLLELAREMPASRICWRDPEAIPAVRGLRKAITH